MPAAAGRATLTSFTNRAQTVALPDGTEVQLRYIERDQLVTVNVAIDKDKLVKGGWLAVSHFGGAACRRRVDAALCCTEKKECSRPCSGRSRHCSRSHALSRTSARLAATRTASPTR